MIRFFVLALALFGAPFFACATNVTPSGSVLLQQTGANAYAVVDGSGGAGSFSMTGRTIGSAVAGAVTVAESYSGTLAGARISILAKRALPAAFAISAAKESFMIGCQAGTELASYLGIGSSSDTRMRCNVTDWLFDEGQPTETVNNYCISNITAGKPLACGASVAAAAQSATEMWDSQWASGSTASKGCYAGTGVVHYIVDSISGSVVVFHSQCSTAPTAGDKFSRTAAVTPVNECPAFTDVLTGNSFPKGAFDPGPDGKCPTGKYDPVSADRAKTIMDAAADIAHAASVLQKILDKGGSLQGAPERTVTGDPQAVGTPTTTTTTNPDGSVTTTTVTPTTNYNYSGNQITVNNSSSSTTQTCTVAGSCTSSTTTKENDDTSASPTDTGMPAVPKLYTQKYPDGLAGVWNEQKAAVEQSALFTWLRSLAPTFGDGGCPTWTLPVDVLNIHTSGDISIPCWLWGTIKLIFNISALLLARRLIFGG